MLTMIYYQDVHAHESGVMKKMLVVILDWELYLLGL